MDVTANTQTDPTELNPDRWNHNITVHIQPTLEPWLGVHQQNKTPIYTHTITK